MTVDFVAAKPRFGRGNDLVGGLGRHFQGEASDNDVGTAFQPGKLEKLNIDLTIFGKIDERGQGRKGNNFPGGDQLGNGQGLWNRIIGCGIDVGQNGIGRAKVDANTESGIGGRHVLNGLIMGYDKRGFLYKYSMTMKTFNKIRRLNRLFPSSSDSY